MQFFTQKRQAKIGVSKILMFMGKKGFFPPSLNEVRRNKIDSLSSRSGNPAFQDAVKK